MTAKLPDIQSLLAAGIDPKTGLPVKMTASDSSDLKENVKKFLRLIDEQDACNRFTWYNVPGNITGQELERLLYYKGQLIGFYFSELGQFYFMPYALNGTIDFYGRFNAVHPLPFALGTTSEADKARVAQQKDVLSRKTLKVVYGVKFPDEVTMDDINNDCVILRDYTPQMPQTIIPRQTINDPILDVMAEMIPFLRTCLLTGAGVKLVRVQNAEGKEDVLQAARKVYEYALKGYPWSAVIGEIDFQDLDSGAITQAEQYLLAMQSLDNFRLSGYGLKNGGLFEKKAHILESENAVNQANIDIILQDGLSLRQNFCTVFNSIYGTSMWCDISESVLEADVNGDGVAYDTNEDGSHSAVDGSQGKGGDEQ